MTIEDMESFTNNLWDWKFLDDCFQGTKIKVSDLDGIVERKGQFLVIECKSPSTKVKSGQKIMFETMAKTGLFTVIVVWGERNKPERMKIIRRNKNGELLEKEYERITEKQLHQAVSEWYEKVNNSTLS